MDNIIIRSAVPGDLKALLEFEQGIVDAERPFDPTIKDGKQQYHDIIALIESTDSHVVIAEVEGVSIGCGYVQIRAAEIQLKHDRYGYVGLIYIMPEHRGKDINRMIIDALGSWLMSQNVYELRLEVYHDNAQARRAYDKAGFKPYLLIMRTQLKQVK